MQIKDLKFDKRNYRKHDKKNLDLIKKSVDEVGFGRSIVIDNENEIIAGNGLTSTIDKNTKIKVVETDGTELVVVKRTDLSTDDLKRKQLAIMDNSASDSSEFDLELLQADFDTEQLNDWGIDVNYEVEEIGDLEVEEDEVPEEVENITKKGDIWKLGNHRLMCGDSTNITDVEKLMNGNEVDLLLTDPPYNVNYEGKTKDKLKIKNDKMEDELFRKFLIDAFNTANTVLKAGGVFYIWHADLEGYNFRGACKDVGWQVRQCLIWNKNTLVMGRQDYQWKHEPCLYGWKDGASHYFIDDRTQTTVIEDKKDDFKKLPKSELVKLLQQIYESKISTSVIDCEKPARSGEHPTMKPIKLLAQQVKNSSKMNDVVLDLFGGSGSTLITCEQLKRKCFTMELDEHYCDVIITRWENLTGQKAELINE